MVGIGIVAVRYNLPGNRSSGIALMRLRTFKFQEQKVFIPLLPYSVMTKIEVMNRVDLFTLIEEGDSNYRLGSPVQSINNTYLRIDDLDLDEDFIGSLPEF